MDSQPPAPKKRSLFTQAALSKKTKPVETEDLIFNRAHELMAERIAEEERKRRKRIVKLEKKKSTEIAESKENTETPPKRRKVSEPVEARDGNDSESSSGPEEPEEPIWDRRESTASSPDSSSKNRDSSSHYKVPLRSPSTRLSARYSKSLQKGESSKSPQENYMSTQGNQPITIDDDDDDDLIILSRNIPPEPQEDDEIEEEEEEFPELVQKARERERLRLAQIANPSKSFSDQNHLGDNYDAFATEPAKDFDPPVEILIRSEIDGTTPLRIKRMMSQRLQEARFAWCDRQIPENVGIADLRKSIFLTWKNKRLFDSTTCVALGSESGKVYLEAWTEETFAIAQKEEEAARKREELGESEEEEEVVQEKVVKIRLVMTAKDMDPVKIFAKNDTFISKLIAAFRSERNIPDEQEVSLWLDGDKLDPEDVVGDADLEDLDNIEVHIK